MPSRTTWTQKLAKPGEPVVKSLDKPFAGHAVGDLMLISTPAEIDRRVRRLRRGTALTIPEFRARLARNAGADFACPLTTGIFLRIVAEAALERLAQGEDVQHITPFWRAIDPESALASKLTCGAAYVRRKRHSEGTPS
jgi:hypothetical protein